MSDSSIYECKYKNKVIRFRNGTIVEEPCCRSPYCPRCHWYRKWVLLGQAVSRFIYIRAHKYWFVGLYYRPIPSKVKDKVNAYFWRRVRRKYGKVEYLHTLQQQGGLLHANYFVVSEQALDRDLLVSWWLTALRSKAKIEGKAEEQYLRPVVHAKAVEEYIVSSGNSRPEEYLPERGRYRKLFYTSPGWWKFLNEHSGERLVEEVVKPYEPE